jgi:HEAT repeat protein
MNSSLIKLKYRRFLMLLSLFLVVLCAVSLLLLTFISWGKTNSGDNLSGELRHAGHPASFWRAELLEPHLSAIDPPADFPLRANPDPEAIPVLLELLHDRDDRVRKYAAQCLGFMGPSAKPATRELAEALEDPSYRVRREAADSLGAIGAGAEETEDALMKTLKDPEESVRFSAAVALWKVTGIPDRPIAVLLEIFSRDDYSDSAIYMRIEAAKAIGGMGPKGSDAVPSLIATLQHGKRDPYGGIRVSAIRALTEITPVSTEAINAIEQALGDQIEGDRTDYVRANAAIALWQVTRKSANIIPVLIEIADRKENGPRIRGMAIETLGDIGTDAKVAVPALMRACLDADRDVADVASRALKRIDPNAAPLDQFR